MAKYYISFSLGDDSRSAAQAQNSATPWKHHPDSNNATGNSAAQALAAGDQVIMAYGETWWDTILTAGESGTGATSAGLITTTTETGFGSGDNPIIAAANVMSGAWADEGGGEFSIACVTQPLVVYNGNTKLTSGTPGALADNGFGWAVNVLYVKIGSDPTGGNIQAASKNYTITDNGKNYRKYENIDLRYSNGFANYYNANVTSGNVINNCILSRFINRGMRLYQCTDPIISNNVITGEQRSSSAPYGIHIGNACVRGNFYGNSISGLNSIGGSGIYVDGASSSANIYSNTIYDINPSSSTCYGINIQNSNSNNIYGNNITNIWNNLLYGANGAGGGINIASTAAANNVNKNIVTGCYQGIIHQPTSGDDGNIISNNLVLLSKVNGIASFDSGTNQPKIINNTVVHRPIKGSDGSYHGHGISTQTDNILAMVNNNLIIGLDLTEGAVKQADFISIGSSQAVYNIEVDYNFYYDASNGGTTFLWSINNGGVITSYNVWTDYKAALAAEAMFTGDEAHSPTPGNGYLRDVSNGYYAPVYPLSPCAISGVNVSLTTDIDGNSVPYLGGFPIGAYRGFPVNSGLSPGLGLSGGNRPPWWHRRR